MIRRMVAWLATLILLIAVLVPGTADAYPSGGRATVTDPGQANVLRSGGSATDFSLVLPQGAHCAGDARRDGYRVFSYLIPHGTDPHVEDFSTTLPSRWYGMYNENQYYMGFPAPGSGQIVDIPHDLVWSRFSADLLILPGRQSGQWDAGVACVTEHFRVENTWSTTFQFNRSPSNPAGFGWEVVSPPGSLQDSGGLGGWAIIAFAAAGILLVGGGLLGRASQRRSRREFAPSATKGDTRSARAGKTTVSRVNDRSLAK